MPVVTEPSAVAEHVNWRRPMNQVIQPSSETDPNPRIPSIMQSVRNKPTISTLLQSSFSNIGTDETVQSSIHSSRKKKNFTAATFRGFGCTAGASQQVSVPAVIRTSADWQGKKTRKKKNKKIGSKNNNSNKIVPGGVDGFNSNCVDFQDVWCGPGIGFYRDASASVDCVVARRNVAARGKIDVEKISHREHPSLLGRRTMNSGNIPFLDSDPEILPECPMSEAFGAPRFYSHVRHTSSEGFAEIMMLRRRLLTGGMLDSQDRFRDWRLDVDNMSYEELLELGERIGRVNTGLKENEVSLCIRKIQLPILNNISTHRVDRNCSICQEDYEVEDELGKLHCGHGYHMGCIRQWLGQKNFCPVCKAEVVIRS